MTAYSMTIPESKDLFGRRSSSRLFCEFVGYLIVGAGIVRIVLCRASACAIINKKAGDGNAV